MEVMDVINRLYKNKDESKWKMIYHAALTYDVSVDTLSNILKMDKKLLLNQLCLQSDILKYKRCITDQGIAEADFIHFFARLFNAGIKKDKDLQKSIINEVIGTDKDMKAFKERYVDGYEITNEDRVLVLKYQLKYGISTLRICSDEYLDIDRKIYPKRIAELPEEYNDLKKKYEDFSGINLSEYIRKYIARGGRY